MKPLKKNEAQFELPFPSDQTISVKRAAKIIDCSENTVYRLLESGNLLSYQLRPKSPHRISYASLVRYMDYLRGQYPDGGQFGTGESTTLGTG